MGDLNINREEADGEEVRNADAPSRSRALRFDGAELSGALGDLGTFIPLLVGLVTVCGLQLAPTLLASGLANVVTGLIFRIPIPVQPMKAIAAVAIAEGLSEAEILAAGIGTGAVLMLLAVTGLVDWLTRKIPKSVVRGLQLGLGVKLLTKGIGMIGGTNVWLGFDSIALGALCVGIILVFYFSRRFPSALVVFALGLGALLLSQPALLGASRLGMQWHLPDLADWSAWRQGLLRGAIPQIPLTVLNSVIAVCALSSDLFPRRALAPRRVAASVGLLNLICCPLGCMPVCHGAGGLAAQHRFGARTGGSMVVLGVAKILLALVFGASLLAWLEAYPQSVLGALLLFGGLELALVCRDQTARIDFVVMILTAGVCLAINTAVGFAAGWLVASLLATIGLRMKHEVRSQK